MHPLPSLPPLMLIHTRTLSHPHTHHNNRATSASRAATSTTLTTASASPTASPTGELPPTPQAGREREGREPAGPGAAALNAPLSCSPPTQPLDLLRSPLNTPTRRGRVHTACAPPQDAAAGALLRVSRHAPRRQRHRLRRPQLRGGGRARPRANAALADGVIGDATAIVIMMRRRLT